MSTASWEEASRCYKCGEPGHEIGKTSHPSRRGSVIHTLRCDNERCRDYDEQLLSLRWSWIIQVDEDGTIPVREPGVKEFAAQAPKDMTERVIAALKANTDEMIDGKAKEIH